MQKALSEEKSINIEKKELRMCNYCTKLVKNKDIKRCAVKKCRLYICKSCTTFINGKPFCNNCVVDILRNDSLLIITKGKTPI